MPPIPKHSLFGIRNDNPCKKFLAKICNDQNHASEKKIAMWNINVWYLCPLDSAGCGSAHRMIDESLSTLEDIEPHTLDNK
jgi:hypothetical protein